MMQTVMLVNSGLWCIGATLFFYAFGVGILTWHWKQFLVALFIMLVLSLAEIVFALLSD